MTENFGDIKESFKQVNDLLNEMRFQSSMNNDNTDKLLIGINTKLDELTEEENTELLKIGLNEVKRGLEDKHKFISSKFADIENAYKELTMKMDSQLSSDEVRRVFDMITTNLGIFSKDFSSQKGLISEIGVQIESMKQDESSKREILRNISLVKTDVEKFSNGFESIILNLNAKFSELNQILLKLDSSDTVADIKKDIENIFMSTNAVLSTMQVIDRKNREFEESISKFITKDDFGDEQERISKLIAQNVQIANYIDGLPTQNHISTLAEKVDTTVGVMNALKNMITESGENNQRMLTAQLESLERKVLNISTEEEFIGFRQELTTFSKEVIESTNAIRQELTATTVELKTLSDFLNSMNVKETFDNFAGLTKLSENSIRQNVNDSTESLIKEITRNKNLTKTDITESIDEVTKKIEKTQEDIKDASKLNMANIIEHIQGLVNDIFSVKTSMHIDSQENLDAIDARFADMKEEMVSTSNFVAQANHKTAEDVKTTISLLAENLVSLQEDLSKSSEDNVSTLKSLIDDVKNTQKDFDITNQGNVEKIFSLFTAISNELEANKQFLCESSQLKFEEVSLKLQELVQNLDASKTQFEENISVNFEKLKNSVYSLPLIIKENQAEFEAEKTELIKENSKNIEEMSEKVQNLFKELISSNDPFKGEVLYEFSGLKELLESVRQELSNTKNVLDDTLKGQISENIESVEKLIEEAGGKYNSAVYGLQNRLSEHLESVQQISQENGFKLDSSFKETAEIKSEIQNVIDRILELQQDSSVSELATEITKKYEGLLLNLTRLEEIFSSKNDASLQNVLTSIDESFGSISKELDEQRKITETLSEETLDELNEKTEIIKNQINLVGTDLLNIFNTRNAEVMASLASVHESLGALSEVDFEQISLGIKNKINGLTFTVTNAVSNVIKEENIAQTQNLTNSITAMNEGLEEIILSVSSNQTEEFKELKTLFGELDVLLNNNSKILNETVSKNLKTIETNLLESQKATNETLLDEMAKLTDPTEFLEAQEDARTEIIDKIIQSREDSTAFIANEINRAQNQICNSILNDIDKAREENKTAIVNDIDKSIEESQEYIVKELLNAQEQNKAAIIDEINKTNQQAQEHLVNELSQTQEQNKTTIIDEINKTKESTQEYIVNELHQAQEQNKAEILSEINHTNQETQDFLVDNLNEKLNEIEKIITTFTENDELPSKIFEKVSDLKQSLQNAETENKTELYKKLEEIVDELKIAQFNNKSEILEKLSSLDFSSLLSQITDTQVDSKLEVLGKLAEVEANAKSDIIAKISHALEENKTTIIDELLRSKEETEEALIEELSENLNVIKEVITTLSGNKELTENISVKIENLHSSIQSVTSQIDGTLSASSETYKTSTQSALSEMKTSFYEKVDDSLDELKSFLEIAQEKGDFTEDIDKIKTNILERLEDFSDTVDYSFKSISSKDDLNKLKEEIKTSTNELFESLQEKMNGLIESGQTNVSEKTDEMNRRLEEMKKVISDEITEKLATLELIFDNQKKDFAQGLESIKTSMAELKENYVDLSINTNMEMSNTLISAQEKIEEIATKLSELNFDSDFSDLTEKVENINFDDKFSELNEKIDSINFDEKFENLENKINDSNVKELIYTTKQDFTENLDSVHGKLDILTNTSNHEMEEGINEIRETLQNQIEGFEKLSKLDSLDEIKEALAPLENLPTVEGFENFKTDIQSALETFENKVSKLLEKATLNQQPLMEKIYAEVSDDEDTEPEDIEESSEENWNEPDDLFENIEGTEDSEEFETLEEPQSDIWQDENERESFLEETYGEFEDDEIDIEHANEIDNNIEKGFKPSSKAQSCDIKEELDSFKTELFESIVEVFNQISFVAEADDIKDFVDEKIDEAKCEIIESLGGISFSDGESSLKSKIDIKEGLRSALGTNFDDILSSLDILHEKANTVDGNCYEIKNEIQEVKDRLLSASEEDYDYTLQDVETDIAKLRLILKDLSETKPEINLEKLDSLEKMNSDIISISARTNKLLLNSNESYSTLKDNLNTFRDVIFQIDNKLKYIDNKESISLLDQKVEKINELMVSSVNSDKVFNQTFIYLAEWIDKADEKLERIEEKLATAETVEKSIANIQKSMLKTTDLEMLLDKFTKQFDKQQEKIKALETKIEKLTTKKETTKNTDIKAIVNEVLNKVQLPEFKPDAKLAKKVDGIDKQLTTLGKNIEKITSYVD